MARICVVPGCTKLPNPKTGRVFCSRHWTYLPNTLRMGFTATKDGGRGVGTPRYEKALATCIAETKRAADFIDAVTGNPLGGGGPANSDVMAEDFKPGRELRKKAVYRAHHTGESYERALEFIVDAIRRRQITEIERARREAYADRVQRARSKREREAVYPEPQSVRDIPTAVETSRRKH